MASHPPVTDTRSEPRNAIVQFPGGLRARWRWGGSGRAADVFALTEAGDELTDLGSVVAAEPDVLCRAELHVDGPALSAFSTVNVLGGTLDIGIDGEIAGVQNATVASGATLNVDGGWSIVSTTAEPTP